MLNIKSIAFKTLFKAEYDLLLSFQQKALETKESKNDCKNNAKSYMIRNGKELSDKLYRAIGNTVRITLDGVCAHEYEYSLESYHISIPYSSLVLNLKRKDDKFTIRKKVSHIEFSNESIISATTRCSKVHLTLDGEPARIYINWDMNIDVPEDNEFFENSCEKPYDKFTGLKHTMEHCKYLNRTQSVIDERYFVDKNGISCGLILEECEDGDGTIHVFSEKSSHRIGFIYYSTTTVNGRKRIEINDTVQSEKRCGHGKAAMEFLIEYAQKAGVAYMYGMLSSVDEKEECQTEWRNGYYESLGFEVKGNKIKKMLK